MSSNEYNNLALEAININDNENPTETTKMRKSSFILREQSSGNILTVHHTIKENNKLLRIVLNVCCFDLRGIHMLAIDRRGCIFVFNFHTKRYWRHKEKVQKPNVAVASRKEHNQYVIGTKEGVLVLLDVEISHFLKQTKISDETISAISFPGQPLEPKNLALIQTGQSALLIDLDTFNCSYRLDFDKVLMSLKFAIFLPNSEHIMTTFTNDTIHIWSSVTLEVVRIIHPMKLRDKKLQNAEAEIQEFTLTNEECLVKFSNKNLMDGSIACYGYKNDGSALLLSTWDNFLMILSIYTFEIMKMYRLKNFVLLQMEILSKPNDNFIVGLTNSKKVVILDAENMDFKLIVDVAESRYLNVSLDNKYLAISQISGELSIWSLTHLLAVLKTQKNSLSLIKNAFKQKKPLKICDPENDLQFQSELKKLLTPSRLQQILQEYHCYPSKYRCIIWCSLLQLPNNRQQYQELLQMSIHPSVSLKAKSIQLKNASLKRALIKCWSCLTHWCKVLAYCDFLPDLIFPFVKMFQQNPLTSFEICCTLIQNHYQLFFEYHPLEPSNYLGLCTNLLQHYDSTLYGFYVNKNISSSTYAWSLLRNSFSEVLDEEQWLCLWDNIISAPLYYLCFVVVAYNIMQKEIITRLPDNNVIEIFFHEQNPLDVHKLVSKAFKLMQTCPATLNPQKYFNNFQAIPSNVYPKFYKYPQTALKKYETKVQDLQNVHSQLDAKMRELELEELKLMQRLENGLKREEHLKRMKDIEAHYQNTLKREEERVNCQRKMLLLYQKEIRQRKGEVLTVLQDSTKRKEILQKERELNCLQNHLDNERMRNDLNLMWAEEELHNQDMELLQQKYLGQHSLTTTTTTLKSKYYEDLEKLCRQQKMLKNDLEMITSLNPSQTSNDKTKKSSKHLDDLELTLNKIQQEFQLLTKK